MSLMILLHDLSIKEQVNKPIQQTFSLSKMRPIVILVFIIILYITKPAIADRIPRNCNALDYNHLRKSCSVCQKLFLMQKNSFQIYRIRVACLTLAKNGCCKNFRLVKISDLNIMEKTKKLRHFSHGFDII